MADSTEGEPPAPAAPSRLFSKPALVRRSEAARFLWGDEESGQVSDLIYGRGERISAVTFALGPGQWFGWSNDWKPLYDQHRFYYVVHGRLAIHDPETGEVEVASAGQALTWQGARYHFGYNIGDDDLLVLDWFAPPERPPDVPETAMMASKRPLNRIVGGRYDLLGRWPDARSEERSRAKAEKSLTTVGPENALNVIHGSRSPLLVSILSSSEHLTGGTFSLRGASKGEPEQHPGDEVVFCLSGRLHVHLPDTGDWFELEPLDCAFVPAETSHEYWSYEAGRSSAVFCVAPGYR